MRFFFIALAETRYLEEIFQAIDEYNARLSKERGLSVGVLVRFSKWKRVCLPCKLAEKYNTSLFVDNGAFTYLSASALEQEHLDEHVVKKWLADYSRWINTWHNYVTAAAMPDVPVHGREFLPKSLRAHRIWFTAQLHKLFAKMVRQALHKMIVVLQGYTLREYYDSLRLHMENYDVLGETLSFNPGRDPYGGVFGVGSVCVRKPSSKGKTAVLAEGRAAGTLRDFMKEFLGFQWPGGLNGFHFFGLHTEAVKTFSMHPLYYASDTGAHGLNYKYKWRTRLGCQRPDAECYRRAVENQIRLSLSPYLSQPLL